MPEVQAKEKRVGLHKALFRPFYGVSVAGKGNRVGLGGEYPGNCENEASTLLIRWREGDRTAAKCRRASRSGNITQQSR